MSELANVRRDQSTFRKRLLTTVCSAALATPLCISNTVAAETDRPQAWIELGGQFAEQENGQEIFAPQFLLTSPRPGFETASPIGLEKPSPTSWDGTAKVTFEPIGSEWIFSVGVLYGKSNRSRALSQQTAHASHASYGVYNAYQLTSARSSSSHTILDFGTGKDVGLGMWGSRATSTLEVGLRYAQFSSRTMSAIASQPTNVNSYEYYHIFRANLVADRSFTGVGPSLTWDSSVEVLGNRREGALTVDWGLDAALLFGRQRANVTHQTTNNYKHNIHYLSVTQTGRSDNRRKNVTVPNAGGFMGLSWRYPNAKLSIGYKADFFFGAMDGGMDTRKEQNRSFYGPFATVSIGLGD